MVIDQYSTIMLNTTHTPPTRIPATNWQANIHTNTHKTRAVRPHQQLHYLYEPLGECDGVLTILAGGTTDRIGAVTLFAVDGAAVVGVAVAKCGRRLIERRQAGIVQRPRQGVLVWADHGTETHTHTQEGDKTRTTHSY